MKNFYKLIASVMLAIMLITSANVTEVKAASDTHAATYIDVTFYYETYGSYCRIVGVDNAIGLVEIPRVVDLYWVTEIAGNAFKNNNNITGVIIPEGVTCIGTGAFDGCRNLSSVVLPNSLKSIEAYAFRNTALSQMYIPDSVKVVDATAFAGTSIDGKYTRKDAAIVTPTPVPTQKPSGTATPVPTQKPSNSATGKDVVLVTVSNLNNPTKIYKGSSYGLTGVLKTDDMDVTTVTGYILDASGKVVMSVSDTFTKGSYNINKGRVNRDLIFGDLAIGKYIYRVTVSGNGIEEQTVIESTFEVVKAAAKPTPTPKPEKVEPTPTPTPTPEPEKPKTEVMEVKTISAEVPLNMWVNVDPISEYGMLTSEIEIVNNSEETEIYISSIGSHSTDSAKNLVDEDSLPGGKDWSELSKRQASKYFYVGISPMRNWEEVESRDDVRMGTEELTKMGSISYDETGSIFVTTEWGSALEEVVNFEIMLGIIIESVR